MTATQMTPAIGAKVWAQFEDLLVLCTVCDVKTSWGKVRLLITPELGQGSQWVEMARVQLHQLQGDK